MISIRTKFRLNTIDTDDYVYVKTIRKIFRRVDGEWIEKKYFTTAECCKIFGKSKEFVYYHAEELGLDKGIKKLNLKQLLILKSKL